jgi:hypothetical protein
MRLLNLGSSADGKKKDGGGGRDSRWVCRQFSACEVLPLQSRLEVAIAEKGAAARVAGVASREKTGVLVQICKVAPPNAKSSCYNLHHRTSVSQKFPGD